MPDADTALVEHQPTATAVEVRSSTEFSREQVELIKRTVARDTSDDELALFLQVSQRTGLDPFARQIYAVVRPDRNSPTGKSTAIQTGIDGYRLIAQRTGLFRGRVGPYWCARDGKWRDVWLDESPPAAAKVGVIRADCTEPIWAVATWSSYAQMYDDGNPRGMWKNMPDVMLAKCAEAQAIRASFPADTSGVYTAEEMDQAHTPDSPGETPPAAATATVDHSDERRELFRQFNSWWSQLDGEGRAEVWPKIAPRLRGEGSISDAFAATPMHVLEDIVETYVTVHADVVDAELVDEDSSTARPEAEGEPAAEAADGPPPADNGGARDEEEETDAARPGNPADPGEDTVTEAGGEAVSSPATDDPFAGTSWREAAKDLGVAPTAVLVELRKGWPNVPGGQEPNKLGHIDALVASNPDVRRRVADIINDLAQPSKG